MSFATFDIGRKVLVTAYTQGEDMTWSLSIRVASQAIKPFQDEILSSVPLALSSVFKADIPACAQTSPLRVHLQVKGYPNCRKEKHPVDGGQRCWPSILQCIGSATSSQRTVQAPKVTVLVAHIPAWDPLQVRIRKLALSDKFFIPSMEHST